MTGSEAARVAHPIEVKGLCKSYGTIEAVRDASFSAERARIFGLIGPDGAGKTTIMRSIVSLVSCDSGEILFQGKPVDRNTDYVRAHIGYMPQRFSLYQDLTVEENLRFFGDLFGVPRREMDARIERLYRFSALAPFRKRRAGALSGGMKQKLALSCMLVHEPEVVVLDEPTFGVDPVARNEFWEILKDLARSGTTILVSTAYMDEALLCDVVALAYQGRLLATDAPARLLAGFPSRLYLAATESPHLALRLLERTPLCRSCHLFGDGVHFTLREGASIASAAKALEGRQAAVSEIRAIEPGLEDLFLELLKG